MSVDARRRWEAANFPAPEWGWNALPDDEKVTWEAPQRETLTYHDGTDQAHVNTDR